jgi:dipeptidase D
VDLTNKTQRILEIFNELNRIPRCSKKEERIAEWLLHWAKSHKLDCAKDDVNNIVIKVPAKGGYQNAPTIVLQGHMDMVCEKNSDTAHDFSRDPIQSYQDGDWLKAKGTTLGADNGIAIAMALALAEDETISHPPLELLFTVDEETGLIGANSLQSGFVKGRTLINIDSEDEGIFTIGCAGGKASLFKQKQYPSPTPADYHTAEITVKGLLGGHSGIDIIERRANANRLLIRLLHQFAGRCEIRLVSASGGTAHNAIPREAQAKIAFHKKDRELLQEMTVHFQKEIALEFRTLEKNIQITFREADEENLSIDYPQTLHIIHFLLVLPHGVIYLSDTLPGVVETSVNFARVRINEHHVETLTSQRSLNPGALTELVSRMEALAGLAGFTTEHIHGYPVWAPDWNSPLLERSKQVYRSLFNKEAVVEVIHAGLECGIIGSKYPGMDMISIGPTIKHPHSPDEKLQISTIEQVFTFLIHLLQDFKE